MHYASELSSEINQRAIAFGARHGLRFDWYRDKPGSPVVFGAHEGKHHGNFHAASYQAILERPSWARRLLKAHTLRNRNNARSEWDWCELDAAVSSDALLMNIFCHPEAIQSGRLRSLLGIHPGTPDPEFGVRSKSLLRHGRVDTTEADMCWGDLVVEAKLTESNFQTAAAPLVDRFVHLAEVFDISLLPVQQNPTTTEEWDEADNRMRSSGLPAKTRYQHYQLIRGVLSAYASNTRFAVMCDARRPDLIESWHTIQRAVHSHALRTRLQVIIWQEIGAELTSELPDFLMEKYGIGDAVGHKCAPR